jgi:hypothetical protein
MRLRWLVMLVVLVAVSVSSGCGWRRQSLRRSACPDRPVLLPAVAVPVATESPCCPPPPCP